MNYTKAMQSRGLTPLEFQVLECLSIGNKVPEIMRRLKLSQAAVHVHCFRIRKKLGIQTRDPEACRQPIRVQKSVMEKIAAMEFEARMMDEQWAYRRRNRAVMPSPGQLNVLRLRAKGLPWDKIAATLHVTPGTAQNVCSAACKRIRLYETGPFRIEAMREWLAKHDPAPHLGVQPDSPMSDPMF